MADGKIELLVSREDEAVAYVSLPEHPGHGAKGIVKKNLRLRDLLPGYQGADLYLDFDGQDRLLGIEILA